MDNMLTDLIQEALKQLEGSGLAKETLKAYQARAFCPIEGLCSSKGAAHFDRGMLTGLEDDFRQQYTDGKISKMSLHWRLRGIRILAEVYDTGTFEWKVFRHKPKSLLPYFYEDVLQGFVGSLSGNVKRIKNYESIIRRFLSFIIGQNILDFHDIHQMAVRDFIVSISSSRPKSMDDVIAALRKFFSYLNENSYFEDTFWMLLSAPRTGDHKVRPCMRQDETNQLIQQADRATSAGKRDFAILALAASTGLRAGDIASLGLADIDWRKNELRIIQGKTGTALTLPLSKDVLTAVADYVLNGRPETSDRHLFIRSCAPYTNLQSGVSIACIFRKYLKAAGIIHKIDDGRTMHGLRRAIGTQMAAGKVPVTTVAQVLGHAGTKATRQYICLDLEGLRACVMGLDSIGGGSQ